MFPCQKQTTGPFGYSPRMIRCISILLIMVIAHTLSNLHTNCFFCFKFCSLHFNVQMCVVHRFFPFFLYPNVTFVARTVDKSLYLPLDSTSLVSTIHAQDRVDHINCPLCASWKLNDQQLKTVNRGRESERMLLGCCRFPLTSYVFANTRCRDKSRSGLSCKAATRQIHASNGEYNNNKKKVVIVGSGWAGLGAAYHLCNQVFFPCLNLYLCLCFGE